MITVDDLLRRGYFPNELPPPFHTESYSDAITGLHPNPPAAFIKPEVAWYASHNLARSGALRRPLGIVNPVVHYSLCERIVRNWKEIEGCISRSPFSGVSPSLSGRAVISSHSKGGIKNARAAVRSSARYLVKTDISRFYPSIYTHSIAWALHGKIEAKRSETNNCLGNILDRLVRRSQGRQSVGLPIGPDSSYIISEMVLGAVDEILAHKWPHMRGVRHVDDYELSCDTRADAEQVVADVQEALAEFELAINHSKTTVHELPVPIEEPWVSDLRSYEFRKGIRAQATDLIGYFDLAFSKRMDQREKAILNYTVSRLKSLTIHGDNWRLVEGLLFQCLLVEPHTIAPVLELFLHYYEVMGYAMDREGLAEVMSKQILHHAPLGHNSEVAWALWALIKFQCRLGDNGARAIATCDDSVASLVALHANERGLIPKGVLDLHRWSAHTQRDDLYGRNWLLAYEASVKEWLPPSGRDDYIGQDEGFAFLRSRNVSFYDKNRSIISAGRPSIEIGMSPQ